MNKQEFWQQMSILEKRYNKKFDKENLLRWWNEFETFDVQSYTEAISEIMKQNEVPTINNVKNKLEKQNKSLKDLNLNSSYWYINLRKMCDKNNKKYYDITNGKELAPFSRR